MAKLTDQERSQLMYLSTQHRPIWGGHLQRGEKITDPDMQRWLDNGLIERVGSQGYRITDAGRASLGLQLRDPAKAPSAFSVLSAAVAAYNSVWQAATNIHAGNVDEIRERAMRAALQEAGR